MSSSDRNTNEANLEKKIKWYTQHFQGRVVQRYRYQRLAIDGHWEWRFNYIKCCQVTARNANKSLLLRYNNSGRHKSSLEKLQEVFTSTGVYPCQHRGYSRRGGKHIVSFCAFRGVSKTKYCC